MKRNALEQKYYREDSIQEQKIGRIKKDFIKFVPFSFFVLIPGAEIFLPPFLMIFPNSVPSQFQQEKKKKEKKEQMLIKRNKAAMTLNQRFPGYLKALEVDELVNEKDVDRIGQLIKDCKRQDTLPIDFM